MIVNVSVNVSESKGVMAARCHGVKVSKTKLGVNADFEDCSENLKQAFFERGGTLPKFYINKGIVVKQINHVTNEVVKELKIYGDLYRYIPILVHQAGFRVGEKIVQHHPRKFGHSKYTVGKFYRGFLDLLTILFTAKYIRRPLHLFGVWGIGFYRLT